MRELRTSLWIAMCILISTSSAFAQVTFSNLVARFDVIEMTDGSKTVSLLAGGPLGLGGTAAGRVTVESTTDTIWLSGEGDVSGVDPSPFFPAGEGDTSGIDPSPFAPEDAAVVTFNFDSAGDFAGIEPSPFKVYVATPSGYVGVLGFENATAESGSLILSGVVIDTGTGTETIPTFTVDSIQATTAPTLDPLSLGALGVLILGTGAAVIFRRTRFS